MTEVQGNKPGSPPGQPHPDQGPVGPGNKPTPPGQGGPIGQFVREDEQDNPVDGDKEPIDLETKAKRNLEIQNNLDKQDPTLPVEAQMMKVGASTPPIKDQYQDSPNPDNLIVSTHDRDSVQPPDPARRAFSGAPPMPLKEKK